MAITVNQAFEEFLKNTVNLDKNVSSDAKNNRAELISALDLDDINFFRTYKSINYFLDHFLEKRSAVH